MVVSMKFNMSHAYSRRLQTAVTAALVCGMIAMGGSDCLAASGDGAYSGTDVEANRIRRDMEQERIRQRIEEGRRPSEVEGVDQKPTEGEGSELKFTLKAVETSKSEVLSEEDLQRVKEPYLNKEVSVKDLYQLVEDINKFYSDRGYLTCKAFLEAQTIKDGVVRITLLEGKTGNVELKGNNSTSESYLRHRIHLKEGEIADINRLNKDLLRFNSTNDMQLRIAIKAGEKVGTTDYLLTAVEPQRSTVGIFSDNAGSVNNGRYRYGAWWQYRSLTGRRDRLFLSSRFSEGTKSGSLYYVTPLSPAGDKFSFSYSANSVKNTDGPLEPLDIKGHSRSFRVDYTHPILTTERIRSEWGIGYDDLHSATSFSGIPWVNDRVRAADIYVDQINYGNSYVFYQKHAGRFGKYKDVLGDKSNFGKYVLNTLYQKAWKHGQQLTFRMDGQISSTNYLPSAEMYYIGGMLSVRGYHESLLGGDSGMSASVEYELPLAVKGLEGYVFLDGGYVWGDSAFGDRRLLGTGLGLKYNIKKHAMFNVGLGFPLIRRINDIDQSRMLVHFSFNGQF